MSLLRIGLLIKALDALLEIFGGVMLFFPDKFNEYLAAICQHELIQRHANHVSVATFQTHASRVIYGASLLAALYLIAHGIVKVIFIGGVMGHRQWGYIGLMVTLGFFTVVEILHSAIHGTWPPFLFGLFDATLAYLVWREWRKRKAVADAT